MTGITGVGRRQLSALFDFYTDKRRPEAGRRLAADLVAAGRAIRSKPEGGLECPQPYPELRQLGFRWRLVRVYWVAWTVMDGRAVITNILHTSADIGRRASASMDDVQDL